MVSLVDYQRSILVIFLLGRGEHSDSTRACGALEGPRTARGSGSKRGGAGERGAVRRKILESQVLTWKKRTLLSDQSLGG